MKAQTGIKLKFDNKSIDKIKIEDLDFSYINKAGETKFKRLIKLPFDVPKKSILKGLKLCVDRISKSKIFRLQFWFNSKSDYYVVGKFVPDVFGTKEVEDKLLPIVRSHTSDKTHWIKNPNLTEKESVRVIKEEDVKAVERRTVNEVIESLMEANMPKISSEGTICAKSLREQSRFLIGYNKRTRFLSYSDDEDGNGRVTFRPNYKTKAPAPDSWSELFKKYPSGIGHIKDKKKNKNLQISLYDNPEYGKRYMDEFKKPEMQKYINGLGGTYSYKKHCLSAIKTLWNFANDKAWLGKADVDPTKIIKIKRPNKYSDLAINVKYNDSYFKQSELNTIFNKLDELSPEYPFATENVKLTFCVGQRQEEIFKLKRKDIKYFNKPVPVPQEDGSVEMIYGKIHFRKEITKRRNKAKDVFINQSTMDCLKQIKSIYKRPGMENYMLVPWLFPSPSRIDKQRLNNQESAYIKSTLTRLRSTKGLWDRLRKETGIVGVVRMARKTLVTLGKDAGLTNKQMKYISHHDQERTIDLHYDKRIEQEIMKNTGLVSNIYKFPKSA